MNYFYNCSWTKVLSDKFYVLYYSNVQMQRKFAFANNCTFKQNKYAKLTKYLNLNSELGRNVLN